MKKHPPAHEAKDGTIVARWRRPVPQWTAAAFCLYLVLPGGADHPLATNDTPLHTAALATQPIKACDLGFFPVKPIEGVGTIIGTAWAQCDIKPATHLMTVSLDRRQGNDWVAATSAPPNPQIPPGPPQRAGYQVKIPCRPGLWRLTAEAHGSGPTGVPFSFTDHSLSAFIQCSRGK